jgi:hypothetical protein
MFPIIDVSRQSISELESEFGRGRAWRYALWFRLARPAAMIGMWVMVGLYLRWCVLSAQPKDLAMDALTPAIIGIACVVTAFMTWTMAYGMVKSRRKHPGTVHRSSPYVQAVTPYVDPSRGRGRRLVVYHDEKGAISQVMSMPEFAETQC